MDVSGFEGLSFKLGTSMIEGRFTWPGKSIDEVIRIRLRIERAKRRETPTLYYVADFGRTRNNEAQALCTFRDTLSYSEQNTE